MIRYEEIHKKETDPTLRENEKSFLVALEKMTDTEIEKQFPSGHGVTLDDSVVDKILKGLGLYRQSVITEHWKKMYFDAGWLLTYNSDREADYWTLTKR